MITLLVKIKYKYKKNIICVFCILIILNAKRQLTFYVSHFELFIQIGVCRVYTGFLFGVICLKWKLPLWQHWQRRWRGFAHNK